MTWQPNDPDENEPAAWKGDNPSQVDIGLYILDEMNQPVKELNPISWAEWLEANHHRRFVAQDKISNGYTVSTVFIGIDASSIIFDRKPRLWETMIFGPNGPVARKMYSSYIDATIGHDQFLATYQRY